MKAHIEISLVSLRGATGILFNVDYCLPRANIFYESHSDNHTLIKL